MAEKVQCDKDQTFPLFFWTVSLWNNRIVKIIKQNMDNSPNSSQKGKTCVFPVTPVYHISNSKWKFPEAIVLQYCSLLVRNFNVADILWESRIATH